jgi:hypothetical protein
VRIVPHLQVQVGGSSFRRNPQQIVNIHEGLTRAIQWTLTTGSGRARLQPRRPTPQMDLGFSRWGPRRSTKHHHPNRHLPQDDLRNVSHKKIHKPLNHWDSLTYPTSNPKMKIQVRPRSQRKD